MIPGALSIDEPLAGSVVTLGAFDGVHLGHQALIHRARAAAQRHGVQVVAYTFDPHPAKVLAPSQAPKTLCSVARRVQLLKEAGADRVVVEPFTQDFSQCEPEAWVRRYLAARLRPQHVVVGFNFSYGRARGGSPQTLQAAGREHGFDVEVIEPFRVGGRVVSSTEVRQALDQGDLETAEALLGRRFVIRGVVARGDQRGRTIGFPTANVDPDHEQLVKAGVYATRTEVDGRVVPSVTNVGRRPTFGGGEVRVETHLFDFDADLYGKPIAVELVHRIRDEKKFDGIESLRQQLAADAASARKALS